MECVLAPFRLSTGDSLRSHDWRALYKLNRRPARPAELAGLCGSVFIHSIESYPVLSELVQSSAYESVTGRLSVFESR